MSAPESNKSTLEISTRVEVSNQNLARLGHTPSNSPKSRAARGRLVSLRTKDGDNCWICGKVMDFRLCARRRWRAATVDHVIPTSVGGPNTQDNLRLAHRKCNSERHHT